MKLAIRFPDQSHSFVHGYEAGVIGHKMMMQLPEVDNGGFPIHATNVQLIKSMCEYYGYIPAFRKSIAITETGEPLKDEITGKELLFDEYTVFTARKKMFSDN